MAETSVIRLTVKKVFLLGKLGESTGKREQGLVEDCGSASNGVFLMFSRKKTLNCSFM